MTLPLVIVNPESADGATQENWPKIASDLRTHFGPFSVAFTEAIGHGRKLANEAAKQGTKLIIACGGDGTISEVANGIIESNEQVALGILPGGTGRYYGGGMKIAPNAKLDDGSFDVVTIGDASAFRILANAPRLYFGTHLRMNEVTHTMAKQVVARPVKKDEEVRIELDGEVVGRLPVTFQIMPRTLRVRCP